MPEPITHGLPAEQDQLEAATMSAIAFGLSRLAQWRSLQASAASVGVPIAAVLPADLIAKNKRADKDFSTLARAVVALDSGEGLLRRWQIGDGAIKWGIAKRSANLGQWQPVALTVIKYAANAAMTYGAWYLLDLWGASRKVQSEAEKLRAENSATCQQTAEQLIATGHTAEGAALARACAGADAAAERPDPSLWEAFKRGIGDIGTGAAIGGGALLAIGLLYLASQTRGKYAYQSPAQFHKPVTFRKPWKARK